MNKYIWLELANLVGIFILISISTELITRFADNQWKLLFAYVVGGVTLQIYLMVDKLIYRNKEEVKN